MTAQPKVSFSVAEYFSRDAQADQKLEYFAGTIVAQAGATGRHNLIVANLIGHLYARVRQKGCLLFPSDMRVQAMDQTIYTYPDITVVCGTPQYLEPTELTLINPTLIIEIMSASTEARDRKEKLEYYRTIASLHEYVLIGQTRAYVQRYVRQTPHFWYVHLTDHIDAVLTLETLEYDLPMTHLYEGIAFG
ncbi:MAG: Uma2 family endonuclease [Chloroflexales bacterium]|nr:Uma2 family endonuclease [Chloroflexales bacterium]